MKSPEEIYNKLTEAQGELLRLKNKTLLDIPLSQNDKDNINGIAAWVHVLEWVIS